jgi:hypothetical protein
VHSREEVNTNFNVLRLTQPLYQIQGIQLECLAKFKVYI